MKPQETIETRSVPKLKLRVESAIHEYLTDRLTDEGFKVAMQSILDEFEGKRLLHQNIGQLAWQMGQENPDRKDRFEQLWSLLDQVSPQIRADLLRRMKQGKS
jgi:hypothetical protein